MGMDLRNISAVINVSLPDTCDDMVQQWGRAGRDSATTAEAWTLVESSTISALMPKPIGGLGGRKNTNRRGAKGSRQGQKHKIRIDVKGNGGNDTDGEQDILGTIDKRLLHLVHCHVEKRCIDAEVNSIYGNPGTMASLPCVAAQRPLPCNSCQPVWDPLHPALVNMIPNTATQPSESSFTEPPADKPKPKKAPRLTTVPLPAPLNKSHKDHACTELLRFGSVQWRKKDGT